MNEVFFRENRVYNLTCFKLLIKIKAIHTCSRTNFNSDVLMGPQFLN